MGAALRAAWPGAGARPGAPASPNAVGAKALVAVGTALAVAVAPTAAVVAALVVSQVLTGVAAGLTISPNQTLTLEGAPGTERGVAGRRSSSCSASQPPSASPR